VNCLTLSLLSYIYEGKVHYNRPPRAFLFYISYFKNGGIGGGGWSAPRPGRFAPGKDTVPIIQEAGWVPGPVWTCAKNLASTRIRFLDRPARSQSLYRLSYPPHIYIYIYGAPCKARNFNVLCIWSYVWQR
jgi:hypothetical protein